MAALFFTVEAEPGADAVHAARHRRTPVWRLTGLCRAVW